jgi:hypothetical protein
VESPAPDETRHQPLSSGLRWDLGVLATILGLVGLLLLFTGAASTSLDTPDSIGALAIGAAALYGAYGIQHGIRRTRLHAAVVALAAIVAAALGAIILGRWIVAAAFVALAVFVAVYLRRLAGNTPRGA